VERDPDAVVEPQRRPGRADVLPAAAAVESVVGEEPEVADHPVELTDDEVAAAHEQLVEATVRAETAAEGQRRLSLIAHDAAVDAGVPVTDRRPPLRLAYPRYGWRRAVRHAVQRRMLTPQYLRLYGRYLRHRAAIAASGREVELQGMVFTGRRVELHARKGHGRLLLGPWCWIGNDNKLRAHEGQLTLGAKVVMGRDNVVNTYLDIEIGDAAILADWIYICDFDHRYDRLDLPIKDQGIVKSPVRVGGDVWIGEKATVLRGVDIGHGSVIASHCLVNRDVPPFSIAVGVPVRVVKSRLPGGIDPEEALDLLRRGEPIPGDPLEG
jgi:acetyltransferase-like isoleucine patch superfamily enzyme